MRPHIRLGISEGDYWLGVFTAFAISGLVFLIWLGNHMEVLQCNP